MKFSKQHVIEHFNHANQYDQFSHIQKIAAKQLIDRLNKIDIDKNKPLSILEIGCGTGFLTKLLLDLFPNAHFVITDISSEMLKRAKIALEDKQGIVDFKQMDGENPSLNQSFDLICSNFTFQWFLDMPRALQQLSKNLNPNGYLLFSTLASKTFIEWHEVYQHHDYPCSLQNYPDMTELRSFWPDMGSGRWDSEEIIDSTSSGLVFFQNLHHIGAQTASSSHIPLSSGQLRRVIAQYDQQYGYTTYQVAYGTYRKFSGKGFFVTGTDTDVGKTFVSACLTKALNATYWKVMQTGLRTDKGDTYTVKQLVGLSDAQIMEPLVKLQEPLSPEEAAKHEGSSLNLRDYVFPIFNQEQNYVVEGAGGALVPITKHQFMTDLMIKVNLPVIIVARTGLGTLNHTLMTIESLRKRHIAIAGVILNGKENKANKEAIIRHGNVKIIAEIPYYENLTNESVAKGALLINIDDMIQQYIVE